MAADRLLGRLNILGILAWPLVLCAFFEHAPTRLGRLSYFPSSMASFHVRSSHAVGLLRPGSQRSGSLWGSDWDTDQRCACVSIWRFETASIFRGVVTIVGSCMVMFVKLLLGKGVWSRY
ncbi:hypothetical protein BDV24DRAFT_126497 [Aspergillus arachidicola]|uniref:Uncharacterized protein n=1 Tax=Aspergillus arachidicola TaxID=656916 RepID=A0A5N6YMW5_9EURO|nr:hypothetical protein BDV24DRAFT_126497 [Aspergillus arachidicola]